LGWLKCIVLKRKVAIQGICGWCLLFYLVVEKPVYIAISCMIGSGINGYIRCYLQRISFASYNLYISCARLNKQILQIIFSYTAFDDGGILLIQAYENQDFAAGGEFVLLSYGWWSRQK
jgi:hypothetical protein